MGSSASLDRSPKKNWVEQAGQLPPYVREVARSIKKPLDQAIPIAISQITKWAAGGEGVTAKTKAKAAKALAQWEALKAKSKGNNLSIEREVSVWYELCLAIARVEVSGEDYSWITPPEGETDLSSVQLSQQIDVGAMTLARLGLSVEFDEDKIKRDAKGRFAEKLGSLVEGEYFEHEGVRGLYRGVNEYTGEHIYDIQGHKRIGTSRGAQGRSTDKNQALDQAAEAAADQVAKAEGINRDTDPVARQAREIERQLEGLEAGGEITLDNGVQINKGKTPGAGQFEIRSREQARRQSMDPGHSASTPLEAAVKALAEDAHGTTKKSLGGKNRLPRESHYMGGFDTLDSLEKLKEHARSADSPGGEKITPDEQKAIDKAGSGKSDSDAAHVEQLVPGASVAMQSDVGGYTLQTEDGRPFSITPTKDGFSVYDVNEDERTEVQNINEAATLINEGGPRGGLDPEPEGGDTKTVNKLAALLSDDDSQFGIESYGDGENRSFVLTDTNESADYWYEISNDEGEWMISAWQAFDPKGDPSLDDAPAYGEYEPEDASESWTGATLQDAIQEAFNIKPEQLSGDASGSGADASGSDAAKRAAEAGAPPDIVKAFDRLAELEAKDETGSEYTNLLNKIEDAGYVSTSTGTAGPNGDPPEPGTKREGGPIPLAGDPGPGAPGGDDPKDRVLVKRVKGALGDDWTYVGRESTPGVHVFMTQPDPDEDGEDEDHGYASSIEVTRNEDGSFDIKPFDEFIEMESWSRADSPEPAEGYAPITDVPANGLTQALTDLRERMEKGEAEYADIGPKGNEGDEGEAPEATDEDYTSKEYAVPQDRTITPDDMDLISAFILDDTEHDSLVNMSPLMGEIEDKLFGSGEPLTVEEWQELLESARADFKNAEDPEVSKMGEDILTRFASRATRKP